MIAPSQLEGKEPTSLRSFCFRMAKRRRAKEFSLLGDMAMASSRLGRNGRWRYSDCESERSKTTDSGSL